MTVDFGDKCFSRIDLPANVEVEQSHLFGKMTCCMSLIWMGTRAIDKNWALQRFERWLTWILGGKCKGKKCIKHELAMPFIGTRMGISYSLNTASVIVEQRNKAKVISWCSILLLTKY